MIRRLRKVNDHLYRGAAPSVEDVIFLNKVLGVTKIVSLDQEAGARIHRAAKLLGIKHVMLPIEIDKRSSLIQFLNKDIVKLLYTPVGATYVHCVHGADRTGLAIALYRCQHDAWSAKRAIKEAKSLGFGIGINPKITELYEKIIHKACQHREDDLNAAYDIVSNQREYPSDYQDYTLDAWQQQSWSPYSDYRVREWPYANTYIEDWSEQAATRLNYRLDDSEIVPEGYSSIPMIGQWDSSTQGLNGAGPSLLYSGYV